jgi:hypothetical protein
MHLEGTQVFGIGADGRHKGACAAFTLVLLVSFAASAPAQKESGQTPGASGPVFYTAPPAGFDPLTAADSELADYGIPPRPDQSEPDLYARWAKMVTAPQTRMTNLTVQTTNVINSTAANRRDRKTAGNTTSTNTDNWSGFAITAPNGTFKANDSFILAEWVVPAIGVDNCSYSPYASSQWVGFDGAFISGDVLQAGTAETACGTSYVAWYEWYTSGCTSSSGSLPCYQTNVSLPISPGDVVSAEVWYTTSSPYGHAYIVNYTAQQSASVGFNQPSGSSGSGYQGNTAEWVVERPGLVGGSLENLANYLSVPMNFAYAYNGSSYYYPASAPSGTTIYDITMTCPPWNPTSACTYDGLSYALPSGTYTLWFDDEGAAEQ